MNAKYYAGVGSRETPEHKLWVMIKIARYLRDNDYILRSGGARGADAAFAKGARDKREIFVAKDAEGDEKAMAIAKSIHPNWSICSHFAKLLHARNVYQVLGKDFKTPVDFLICWTPDGKYIGGTRTAMVLADQHNIPIINIAVKDWQNEFQKLKERFNLTKKAVHDV